MCGFAGFLTYGPGVWTGIDRRRTLVSMGDAIARRGPDDTQYYDDGTLALVYRRLAIMDVGGGRQPFFDERREKLLVANGEIYNHEALRVELAATHRFRSRSDCEVLLHGLEAWGVSTLERLQGMFALAHWNTKDGILTLARDRLGIKPLYICRLPEGFLFASELKALLAHPKCPRTVAWNEVDRQPISLPAAASFVKGVELLPGGECITIDAHGRANSHAFWRLNEHLGSAPFGTDIAKYSGAYADLLEEVISQHLQREVGAAIHLSGGVDSSIIAGVISAIDKSVPCLTVVERNSYLDGDVNAAQRLTSRLGLPWLPVRFDYRTIVEDMRWDLSRLEEAVWMMDSPNLDVEWLFKAELHRVTREHLPDVKVILLGQGADEFAGGYSRRIDAMRTRWSDYVSEEILPNLAFDDAMRGLGSNEHWHIAKYRQTADAPAPYHQFMTLLTRQLQHHNLWHEDRTSSWHALEARVPFLDHRLVELLASVPATLHERLFWNKRIVRDALQRFLPGHLLTQPKMAFLDGSDGSSKEVMLHSILSAVVAEFREKYVRSPDGPFDPEKLDSLLQRALSRGPNCVPAMQDALKCIAISIFHRQVQQPFDCSSIQPRESLRLMAEDDWVGWSRDMTLAPKCRHPWDPSERIEVLPGIEFMAPIHRQAPRVCFFRDGSLAGELSLDGSAAWVAVLIRNLGTQAAAQFTVQDWLDEFDIELNALSEVLDILFHLGVVRPAPIPPDAGIDSDASASTSLVHSD